MKRAKRRRKLREGAKELLYDKYNKENYPELSRQERKKLARVEVEGELDL
jgi:hypothetical protein